jgi:hypothetical protein
MPAALAPPSFGAAKLREGPKPKDVSIRYPIEQVVQGVTLEKREEPTPRGAAQKKILLLSLCFERGYNVLQGTLSD